MITPSRRKAFTIVELLVVIAIIALLVSILLPAIGKARDQAKLTQSLSNLKNLGVAHASYAAEWNGRQFTLIDDNIGKYGPNADVGFQGYAAARNGRLHPGINFGTATNADGTSGSYIWTHEAGALPIHSCATVGDGAQQRVRILGFFPHSKRAQFQRVRGQQVLRPHFLRTQRHHCFGCHHEPGPRQHELL